MLTCRECKLSQEFHPYNAALPPIERQNVYCQLHDTAEPVYNWYGLKQNQLKKEPAPKCFVSRRSN